MTLPKGKGLFVRTVDSVGGVDRVVQWTKWAGVSWLCVQFIWQYDNIYEADRLYNLNRFAALRDKAAQAGIALWLWGYPNQMGVSRFGDALATAQSLAQAEGVILDPESSWYNQTGHATALVQVSREAVAGKPVGVTSYGYPPYHPSFPWSQFAAAADFGVPQVYKGVEIGPDYQKLGVEAYQALGFKAVIPALAAYDFGPAEMLAIYERTPRPDGAVIWWDMYHLDQMPQRWSAIVQAGRVTPPKRPTDITARPKPVPYSPSRSTWLRRR
jgi:hypothetical protein